MLQITGMAYRGTCLLRMGSSRPMQYQQTWNGQRRAARFVKGDYSSTSSVTAMLSDLKWNTLPTMEDAEQECDAIQSCSSTGFYPRHTIPDISKSFKRSQHEFPHPTVDSEHASLLLLKCHPYLEPAAIISGLNTQLGDLQGPAAIQHHVTGTCRSHSNFNLYIHCF